MHRELHELYKTRAKIRLSNPNTERLFYTRASPVLIHRASWFWLPMLFTPSEVLSLSCTGASQRARSRPKIMEIWKLGMNLECNLLSMTRWGFRTLVSGRLCRWDIGWNVWYTSLCKFAPWSDGSDHYRFNVIRGLFSTVTAFPCSSTKSIAITT